MEDNVTTARIANVESAMYDVKADIRELQNSSVPFIVYEGTMARFERTVKRLIILIGITILLLFASNAIWIYEWNQYDYADVTMDNTDGGNANYMGANASGVINNGEPQSEDKD